MNKTYFRLKQDGFRFTIQKHAGMLPSDMVLPELAFNKSSMIEILLKTLHDNRNFISVAEYGILVQGFSPTGELINYVES